ncbi:MAG: HYR domain-containing protein [Blastocatellia bacterium]
MSKAFYRIAMMFALVVALGGGWWLAKSRVAASAVQKTAVARARLSDTTAIHAARRGFPFLNLTDGHSLLTSFEGEAESVSLMASPASALRPLALASADLDEDGVADLICTYDSPRGPLIAVYRGNVDALHPHAAEANQRRAQGTFTDAPFLAPARLFAAPIAGEFVIAGDVNGDGHVDLVITARASRSLYVMIGDGQGGFGATKEMGLPGAVTALAAGDVNRADGLTDLLVGVMEGDSPRALIFADHRGALDAIPESFALPAAATDFAVGHFDDDAYADIAIASGRSLILLCGRDRELATGAPTNVIKQAVTGRRDFAFNINSITAGRFGQGRSAAVGLLAEDGAVYVLRAKMRNPNGKAKQRAPQWTIKKLSSSAQPGATRLQMAHLSSLRADDLLLLDATGRQMRVIETATAKQSAAQAAHPMAVDFEVEGEAVAALPMRLNTDALDDIVVLRRGDSAPTILTSAPAAILTVTNTGDNGGVDPMPGAGTGTLRQAIVDANATVSADTIQFSIGTGLQTIVVSPTLPTITEPVTIDGTTQPGFSGSPLIQISAISASGAGLDLQASNSVVSGLVINGFPGAGIFISDDGSNNNIIIGNFIGTNASGTAAIPNGSGVSVVTLNNQIGGTTSGAGNLLSGNTGPGVDIAFDATGNVVRGNKIGTTVSGNAALPNGDQGVGISQAMNNTIGGVTPGSGNLISGNNGSGIFLTNGVTGTLIQGNLIGTNAAGTGALQNDDGIVLSLNAAGITIGGESTGAGNTIAFNLNAGVSIVSSSSTGNAISGNSIFSNGGLGINLSDDMVTPNDNCDADTGPNNLQNFPVLTSASSGGGQTVVQGTLDSEPGATFTVEFFSNATCDASGNGEGRTFIGSTSVTTTASCTRNFSATLSVAVAAGEVITATAISSTGDTSEFSPCITVTTATANLSIEVGGLPDPVPAGSDLELGMQIVNGGPNNAVNVTLTDAIPAHTTFKSLMAPPGWNCSTPNIGGTGTITCTTSAMLPGEIAEFTLVVTVDPSTPIGTTISFMVNVESSTSDPDTSNNSGNVMIPVAAATCAFICPQNITANSSAAQCGNTINYPVPSAAACQVTCAPPPGTVFTVGTTTVTCSASGAPSCSFTITVVDNTPPAITCPFPLTVATDRGKTTAVVNYVPATATDACGVVDVVCLPPSGSTFALGTATINCTARDLAGNTSNCSFTVTVNDADAPVINCPQNIARELPATQSSAVINYPPPTATDNQPGVVVTCAPPSGSTFPLGVSTVICVATDVSGNRATCGFSVSLTGGPTNIEVIIPTGHSSLEFGTDQPVPVPRKNKNRATGPCAAFTIVNRSFNPLNLTLDSIVRIGSDVGNGHISDPREGDLYSLSIVNANGADTPLDINGVITIPVSGRVSFCLRFTPTVPAVAGGTTQLSASQAIPDQIASRVVFRVTGGSTLSVNVNALVETDVRLINANNPKKPAMLSFTKSGDEFTVTFAVYDANNDVSRARYEFLDAGGTVIAGPFDVDLAATIRDRNLTRGQSFTVTQRFTGASSNRNVVAVRVTVTDSETSVTSPIVPLDLSSSAVVQAASRQRFLSVLPPPVWVNPRRP